MFGHRLNLDHAGVICILVKIGMCLVMGVIPCISKKNIAQSYMEGVWS